MMNDHCNSVSTAVQDSTKSACQFCGKYFKSVKIHISKAHPAEYRKSIISTYTGSTVNLEDIAVNNNVTQYLPNIKLSSPASDSSCDSNSLSYPMKPWEDKILNILINNNPDGLDILVSDVISFFIDSIRNLPGPQHPATKYYKRRRAGKANMRHAYSATSNPKKRSQREREKIREKYSYDLAQYNFYNHRRKVVRQIMNTGPKASCSISTDEIESYYKDIFGSPNNLTSIDSSLNNADDNQEILEITAEEINIALSRIKMDTSPGPDNVTVRVLKYLKAAKFLALLGTAMLRFDFVPQDFKKAKTVLIHKSGDFNDLKNWRPITIFSVLRRIIERALDQKLRRYISISCHQRGFVSTPGTHINTSLINGCLKTAKNKKSDCYIAFLDVTKAFDCVGHEHIARSLAIHKVPTQLRKLIVTLLTQNEIQIETLKGKTKPIQVNRGVPQGSPLSPTLFNLALDGILKDLTDNEVSDEYGFSLNPDLQKLSALAFADDIALISRTEHGIQSLLHLTENSLSCIGLHVNPAKSKLICIKNGHLSPIKITSLNGTSINALLQTDDCIKYLGVNFREEIVFDEKLTITTLNKNISKLCASPLLKPDQKIIIINQYIWPSLVYPLQCAPLKEIRSGFLNDVDKMIRGAAKEIIGLPHDCPDGLLYAPMKFRGLVLMRATWEVCIQHINICNALL